MTRKYIEEEIYVGIHVPMDLKRHIKEFIKKSKDKDKTNPISMKNFFTSAAIDKLKREDK